MSYSELRDNTYSRYNTLLDATKGLEAGGPAPLNYSMSAGIPGAYGNLRLKPKGCSTWRHPPAGIHPREGKYFVVQGSSVPLRNETVFTELPKDSMFIFGKNVSSPACCPATHSTYGGCVCTDGAQRDLIGMYRGGNSTVPTNPPI